ncbi:hypothetical protein A7U60_g2960 [Sanghuangporus baumii]|uniref:Uncharacterized protein n=1 Tax=Sanghuangporus baumii TaxID=108892 RepID=A0A9Q5I1L4_SANBA|nr:hypothetical protein A7U60_g2960 [Sanghuangporus baumii]
MGVITRAMAKRLAANNGGSEASGTINAEVRRTVTDGKDSAVNVDMERDVNESYTSANNKGARSNEVLKSKIYTESESITPCEPPSTDPKSGTNGRRRRGTKATRATKPRRVRQATERKGGSSRGVSTPDVSGKISQDHGDAKHNNGTSEDTSIASTGRKRGKEETSDADLQTGHVVPTRAKTRRIQRDIRRSPPVGEAPSDARKLLNCTNSSHEVMTNDDMGLITRAMAKKLAANNGGSEACGTVTAEVPRTITDAKDSTVNADMERDVNESCISANNTGAESNEVLNPKIYRESEPIATRTPPSTDPKSGTIGHDRGTKATRATKPRRVRQAIKRKDGSSRGTSTPDVFGNMIAEIPPDHVPSGAEIRNATHNNGASQNTSVVAAGQKRSREETSEADSQTDRDIVSARTTPPRRIRRNTRQGTFVDGAPSVARNLRDSTNSSPETKANDVLNLPASQYGAEHRSDEIPIRNSVSGPAEVCSGQSPREKENVPAARLTSSPLQRSRRKGTCSEREFVLARAMLALSKPRISSRLQNNPGPSGERKDGATALSLPDLPNEAVHAPTWEAPRLDPDDFAFLVRRTTPYRFEESNMRNEAIIRPAQEE